MSLQEDRMAAARRHDAMIDQIDREIADEKTPEYRSQLAAERAAIERWGNLPPVRLCPGVRACRMSDAESDFMDRAGY